MEETFRLMSCADSDTEWKEAEKLIEISNIAARSDLKKRLREAGHDAQDSLKTGWMPPKNIFLPIIQIVRNLGCQELPRQHPRSHCEGHALFQRRSSLGG